MAVVLANMTEKLESKLSMKDAKEHVDFLAHQFFLVWRLNNAKEVILESFCIVVWSMWIFAVPVEEHVRGDRFLFTFLKEHDMI